MPMVIGEYGIDKRNTTTAIYSAFPRQTHITNLFSSLYSANDDIDGFFFWHYTNLFDDNNYNIYPAGLHVAPNANSNA
ncbi:MAG: hypothetical protein ACJ795_14100, partial [Ktedonobacteraceae bacterium]